MTDEQRRWARRQAYATVRAGTVAVGTSPKAHEVNEIIARGEDVRDYFTIEGSGFVADPRGIVITAKHVLKEWIAEREAMRDQSVSGLPSFPFVISQVASPQEFGPTHDPTAAEPNVWVIESYSFLVHDTLDLAAILLVGNQDLPGPLFPLAPAGDEARVGDEIIAAGFPLGLTLHRDTAPGLVCTPSMAAGVVSAILPSEGGPLELRRAIQFDATIVRGASGGPVCDLETGHVVGVTTDTWELLDPQVRAASYRPREQFVAFPRAIPLFEVRRFVERARREWEVLLNPITRHFHRLGMPIMFGFLPDPGLPWLSQKGSTE